MNHAAFLMLSYDIPDGKDQVQKEFESWLEENEWQRMFPKTTWERLEVTDEPNELFSAWKIKLQEKRAEYNFNQEQMPIALLVGTEDPADI